MFVDDEDVYGGVSHTPEELKQQQAISEWRLHKASLFRSQSFAQFRAFWLALFPQVQYTPTDWGMLRKLYQYGGKWQIDCCDLALKAMWNGIEQPLGYVWSATCREAREKKAKYKSY